MSITTHVFRYALTAAALCAAGSTADAKPRRVVVLDFDGPRGLADSGKTAVVEILGQQYDMVAAKRWEQARASASKNTHGPQAWSKAAKVAGVDAVIEGWVQDEGRHKVLSVTVREANSGRELDLVTVKIGKFGLSDERRGELGQQLDAALDWVDPGSDTVTSGIPTLTPRQMLGAKKQETFDGLEIDEDQPRPSKRKRNRIKEDGAEDSGDETPKTDDTSDEGEQPAKTKPKASPDVAAVEQDKQESNDLVKLLNPDSDEPWPLPKKPNHVPVKTPRFMIGGGGFYGSRSLEFEADGETDSYHAVGKGLLVNGAVYPFPTKKEDGILSGVGFSLAIFQSAAGEVGVGTEDTVGNYQYNHHGWDAAIHYRTPLGDLLAIDGEVGYGRDGYTLAADVPIEYEIPDTEYTFFQAGAHLDLYITSRATIGFGGRYLYVTDTGPMSDVENWYGAGQSSGLTIDGNFVVPLPAQLYLKGELKYRRIKTNFDGSGIIADEEVVFNGVDSFIHGDVHIGIQF